MAETIEIPVGAGELIDKITILAIKSERIEDAAKLHNVRHELSTLSAVRERALEGSRELTRLTQELTEVNKALWDIEDDIRRCEARQDFGPEFIRLARAVYQTNDKRADLKREINVLTGSDIIEEKSYEPTS